tara:strand:+ start:22500 stop:22640 length:141 start_codon:yes stop_codon:yes gene_type:complete
MSIDKKDFIKVQEWIVRFNGEIKHSEKLIDKEKYYKHLKDSAINDF